jgi:hypothetical protein
VLQRAKVVLSFRGAGWSKGTIFNANKTPGDMAIQPDRSSFVA